MTSIIPTPVNIIDKDKTYEEAFNRVLRSGIEALEGNIYRIYSDSVGIPTMGIGYALFDRHENDVTKEVSYSYRNGSKDKLDEELKSIGIVLSPSDWALLDDVK